MTRPLAIIGLLAIATSLAGCASTRSGLDITVPATPASQPATAEADVDVQPVTGQIAAGVQAELRNQISAELDARATGIAGDATGYNSEFGVGATIVVGIAILLQSLVLLCVVKLSHQREMARLARADPAAR